MDSACTVDLLDRGETPQFLPTGFSRESHERPRERTFGLSRIAKAAGVALSLAVSPLTAMPDPWLLERRRRDAVVTVSIYQEVIGRVISRSEALQMARQILEQAERERLAFAEFEAARGIQWGDEQ
jgi:hypothetical protein